MRRLRRLGIAAAGGVAALALGVLLSQLFGIEQDLALFPVSLLVNATPTIADLTGSGMVSAWLFSDDTYPLSFRMLMVATQIVTWSLATYLLVRVIERRRRGRQEPT